MDQQVLYAGAARRVITPPVGVSMSGWNPRASGDIRARYVHDDLYAKALVLQRGDRAWGLIAVDLTGVDAVATAQIRQGAAERTGLAPDAIMVCATHTHSGPAVCPVATTYSPEDMARLTVRGRWVCACVYGRGDSGLVLGKLGGGDGYGMEGVVCDPGDRGGGGGLGDAEARRRWGSDRPGSRGWRVRGGC